TDLAIMVRPPTDLDTLNQPFAPHPYVIIAAPTHPLVGVKGVPLKRLIREPFVVRERASDTWHSMEEGFGAALSEINIAMEIRSTETIKQ
ncbi:LysR substrate-binding domain-containing protein, partial [Vibrio parahaemolyticus]